ncbi:MAG: glycosyltransferase family 39 protein [Planctomycetaceae bacterium]|nr:glycosyltransferase family 39 protein [Planctomycetaceae bacterium]
MTRAVWLLLLLALTLRIAAAVVVDQHVRNAGRTFLIEGDANGYWELGQKIATRQPYEIHVPPRKILRTPGFPLFLAASIRIFGNSVLAASLLMAVVGTSTCWLTWLLAKRLFCDRIALITLAIVAVSPLQIGSSIQILSEGLFSFWILVSLLSLQQLWQVAASSSGTRFFLMTLAAGVVIGLGTLVRPGWLLWAIFCLPAVILAPGIPSGRKFAIVALIPLGCWLALVPWAWRNYEATGHWVHTSLWSGPSLYDGLHLGATGASDMTFVDQDGVYQRLSEYDANEHYKALAVQFVFQNPWRTVELGLLKAGRYLSPTLNASGFTGGPMAIFCLAWYAFFAISVGFGLRSTRSHRAAFFLLAGPFLQFLLVHMVFVGSIRYRLPVEFPLTILAAAGIDHMIRRRVFDRTA